MGRQLLRSPRFYAAVSWLAALVLVLATLGMWHHPGILLVRKFSVVLLALLLTTLGAFLVAQRKLPSIASSAWFLGKLALVGISIEVMLQIAGLVVDIPRGPVDVRAYRSVYDEVSWSEDYFAELSRCDWGFAPYLMWRRKPFTGEYINIGDDGIRRTWNVEGRDTPADTILVFGGSTMWGTGARDEYTIPSHIAKLLAESGRYHVVNCGESAYSFEQEVVYLTRLLRGGMRPRLVVLYDGVNDVYNAWQNRVVGEVFNFANLKTRFEGQSLATVLRDRVFLLLRNGSYVFAAFQRFETFIATHTDASSGGRPLSDEEVERLAAGVSEDYAHSVRLVNALAAAYGFESAFFWQPVTFTEADLTDEEKTYPDVGNLGLQALYRRTRAVLLEANPGVYDVSGVLSGRDSTVYIDYCHLSEQANGVVAEAILDSLGMRPVAHGAMAF